MYEDLRIFYKDGKTKDYEFRKNALISLRDKIIEKRDLINIALYKDLGKSEFESEMSEIAFSLMEINYLIKNLKNLMKKKKVRTSIINFHSKSYTFFEPHGLVLIISPWNYPFNLSIVPLAASIAAGNVSVLKTSSSSPNTSKIIKEIVEEIFEEDFVKIEVGDSGVNEKVMSEKYDFIFFTGGEETGRKIYKKAAEDLTEIALELGGKSPCIVDDNIDFKIAAQRIVWGKFLNCGQTCVSVDYILVKENSYEYLINEIDKSIIKFYGENPMDSKNYGKIINEKEYNRLVNILIKEKVDIEGNREKLKIAPHILKANWDSPSMKEEIFGPILPIIKYKNIDRVIEVLNSKKTPLALYIFSKDKNFIKKVSENVKYGGGCVNDTITHLSNSNLPFGGSGESGFGRYHGKSSFETFSRQKSILDKSYFPEILLRYPSKSNNVSIIKKIMK